VGEGWGEGYFFVRGKYFVREAMFFKE